MHLYYLLPAQVTTIQTPYSLVFLTCVGDIHKETFSFYKITKVWQSWALGLIRRGVEIDTDERVRFRRFEKKSLKGEHEGEKKMNKAVARQMPNTKKRV
ncbi:hypothetical protein TNIN_58561 [Trichonephila inaurata madagascariensis]|uniref:Uncharacterized protein n=1 Tax=Trichonephila inaurata madagascariensis TaxID=2747483 RepID=A0A8X6XEW8_9ARAC|nr:hypothetical protein TNIN_58561 [Trichonephila inaurata madagascariensis]